MWDIPDRSPFMWEVRLGSHSRSDSLHVMGPVSTRISASECISSHGISLNQFLHGHMKVSAEIHPHTITTYTAPAPFLSGGNMPTSSQSVNDNIYWRPSYSPSIHMYCSSVSQWVPEINLIKLLSLLKNSHCPGHTAHVCLVELKPYHIGRQPWTLWADWA